MATYLGTHGSKIQNYTTNPDNPNEGEVWYNETDQVLKFQYPNVTSAGSWRTANSLNVGRLGIMSAVNGTYTAALAAGGNPGGTPEVYNGTELYDGTSWTEVNNLNTAREGGGGAGTQTAALVFGGTLQPGNSATTESWNGTNWTEVNDLQAANSRMAGAGTQTSALSFSGGGNTANTE